jgi:acetyl-CoA carboxylase carboxyltransferase component
MVRGVAQMYITGPDVVRSVTGEDVSHEQLGGADVHAAVSGAAGFVSDSEEDCLADVRHLLSLLPANNRELPPAVDATDSPTRPCAALVDLVPGDPSSSYDMRAVLEEVVDDSELFEVHASWARNIICGFARLDGQVVGIVANQPAHVAGVVDIHAAEKAARFVSTCDAFNVPLVTFVDVPGFLPGRGQEHDGIIRHGAKLLYAYCDATVPRIQVIVRKAYGGAYIVMDSRSIGADLSFAWPSNEIAVMGAEGAANVVFRREIEQADDPVAAREYWIKEYRSRLVHPLHAAERGLVDDVIDPADTRAVLVDALEMLRAKHAHLPGRKHGNPPT